MGAGPADGNDWRSIQRAEAAYCTITTSLAGRRISGDLSGFEGDAVTGINRADSANVVLRTLRAFACFVKPDHGPVEAPIRPHSWSRRGSMTAQGGDKTMSDQNQQAPSILRRKQVQARTGLARSTIYLYMKTGAFPRSVPLGPHSVGWLESDVSDWISQRVQAARGNAERAAQRPSRHE